MTKIPTVERTMGIVASAGILGFKERSADQIIQCLRPLPWPNTAFAIARQGQLIHFEGATNQELQISLAGHLLGDRGQRRVGIASSQFGRIYATYDGLTKLALLAAAVCKGPSRELTATELELIGELIPSVHSVMFEREREAPGPLEASLDLFLSLAAGAPGMPVIDLGAHASLSKLALHYLETGRVDRLNRALLVMQFPATLGDIYRIALASMMNFAPIRGSNDYRDAYKIPHGESLSLDEDLICRLASDLDVARSLTDLTDDELAALVTCPRQAWPASIATRPFFVGAGYFVCWNVRALHSLMTFRFDRIFSAIVGRSGGEYELSDPWNSAIERAIEHVLRYHLPNLTRPPLSPVEGAKPKNAEWVFASGDDLFVLEFKNLDMTHSSFKRRSFEYFENWLLQKVTTGGKAGQGFAQVYATIEQLAAQNRDVLGDGRAISQFLRIWPMVITPQTVPADRFFMGTIGRLVGDDHSRISRQGLPIETPLVVCLWDLFSLVVLAAEREMPLGQVLTEFVSDPERPPSLNAFLHHQFGAAPMPRFLFDEAERLMGFGGDIVE